MNHKRIVLLCVSVVLATGVTFATSDPPELPQGGQDEPLGAGCLGGQYQVVVFFAADGTLGITWREFQDAYAVDTDGDGRVNYLPWVQGTFDPLAPLGPCAMGAFD